MMVSSSWNGPSVPALGLLRFPVKRSAELVAVSSVQIVLDTHWVGHSVLCPGDNCPLCTVRARRPLGFLAVAHGSRRCLLELTGPALSDFAMMMGGARRLLGTVFKAERPAQRRPLRFTLLGQTDVTKRSVVPLDRLAAAVGTIYQLPVDGDLSTIEAVHASWSFAAHSIATREALMLGVKIE